MTVHEPTTLGVLDLRAWARPIDLVEREVLSGLAGPVLEVGCGPGRLVAALAEAGIPALGIDISPLAAELAAERGAPMLARSVFEQLPHEGRWSTVLLIDGSIGIGGDPTALLRRVRRVLAPGGLAVVEVKGPGIGLARGTAHVACDAAGHEMIPWAELGVDHLDEVAANAGFTLERGRRFGRRWFSWLRSTAYS